MSDMNNDDFEIQKILEPYRLKKPPASVLKDFDSEVMEKIKAPNPFIAWGAVISLSLGAVFLFALIFLFLNHTKPVSKARATQILSQSTDAITVQAYPEKEEQVQMEDMARDLLILEMLGEDEGVLDAFEGLETDAELLIPTNSPL